MSKKIIIILVFFIICVIYVTTVVAKSGKYEGKYNDKVLSKINACLKIPKHKLIKKSCGAWFSYPCMYYERSACFYNLAMEERKPDLCSDVIHHKDDTIYYYNLEKCRKNVTKQVEKDKEEAKRYYGKLYQIDNAYFYMNGNGKDYDFIFNAYGDIKASYHLKLEIFDGNKNLGTLYEDGWNFIDKNEERWIYIERNKLINLLKNNPVDKTYQAKATFSLNIEDYIISHIHDKDKFNDTKTIDVNFSKLTRKIWKPN